MGDSFFEIPIFEPCEFQLANGNSVRVVFAYFWERLTDYDRSLGAIPTQYFAIRVYSNEDEESDRMTFQYEFRDSHEFHRENIDKVWGWLNDLIAKRGHIVYEDLGDFVEDFAVQTAVFLEETADDHINHVPEIHDPESFDNVDDSVYNDQNED